MVPLGYIRIHTGMYPNCNMIYYPTENTPRAEALLAEPGISYSPLGQVNGVYGIPANGQCNKENND